MNKKNKHITSEDSESFLRRWSRLKLKADDPDESGVNEHGTQNLSGQLKSETDEKLSAEMLNKLFHTSQYNKRDHLDDYDENYTYFEKLGDILTHEVKHAMNEEQKTKPESNIISDSKLSEVHSIEIEPAQNEVDKKQT